MMYETLAFFFKFRQIRHTRCNLSQDASDLSYCFLLYLYCSNNNNDSAKSHSLYHLNIYSYCSGGIFSGIGMPFSPLFNSISKCHRSSTSSVSTLRMTMTSLLILLLLSQTINIYLE